MGGSEAHLRGGQDVSEWIIDGKPDRLRNHRVLECGRRVHASILREDLEVRVQGQWSAWWERLQQQAKDRSGGQE